MFSSRRLAAFTFLSLLFTTSVLSLVLPVKRAQLCNGHADLCQRSYGNTTFLGAHDSFAISDNFFALARDQEVGLLTQLNMGVRMLQAQGHMSNNELHFCHTSCSLFDGGTVEDYLRKVKYFLDRHPNEVLTLLFTNPEHVSVPDVWKPIFDKTGISDIAYVPPKPVMARDDWPSLGQMIESNKRVVVFMDVGAEKSNNPTAEYILPEFDMVWEDKFDPTDDTFPCKVDRTMGSLMPGQQLNLINHNLNVNIFPFGSGILLPNRLQTPFTNDASTIMRHVAHCAPLVGNRNPNFVLLDFVNIGQGLDAVDRLNGFSYES